MQEKMMAAVLYGKENLRVEQVDVPSIGPGDLLVFPVEELISRRLSLEEMEQGIELARQPAQGSLKLIVNPQR